MKKIFHIDGEVYYFLTKIYNLLVINLLVIIFSLPIVTIGSAMSAAYRVLIDDEEQKSGVVIKKYVTYFKSYVYQGSLLILGSAIVLVLVVFSISQTINTPFQFLCLVIGAFVSIVIMNLFITVAYRSMSFKEILAMALGISMKYTGYFCLTISSFAVSLLIPIFLPKLAFIWFFYGISLPMFFQTKIYLYCVERFKARIVTNGGK